MAEILFPDLLITFFIDFVSLNLSRNLTTLNIKDMILNNKALLFQISLFVFQIDHIMVSLMIVLYFANL